MKTLQLQIPRQIEEIIRTLNKHYEVYFVGGCVRNLLLNKPIHDYDCTTSATVDEMKQVLSKYKIIETGIKHGTLTIMNQYHTVEITTYRIDQEYVNHRTPTNVVFTRNIHEDLKRRDFTINALACDIEGHFIDDHNGLNDLENKIIRCVGDPIKRFDEDALRILRAIRFACTLDFKIEENTEKAIFECLKLLPLISVERKFEELSKILTSNQNVYQILSHYNLFYYFNIPTHPKMKDDLEHAYNDLDIRIASLFHSKNVARKIMKSWHLSNKRINLVSTLVEYRKIDLLNNSYTIRKMIYNHGIECTRKILLFKRMDVSLYESIIHHHDYLEELAINGKDCIEFGYEGKEIHKILQECIDYVLHDLSRNNKDELIKKLRK